MSAARVPVALSLSLSLVSVNLRPLPLFSTPTLLLSLRIPLRGSLREGDRQSRSVCAVLIRCNAVPREYASPVSPPRSSCIPR